VRGWAKLPAADAAILAAAGEAGVDGLVSGDRHFLDLTAAAGKAGLLILTPAACAARYLEPASGI
jgi:hypothetical protein